MQVTLAIGKLEITADVADGGLRAVSGHDEGEPVTADRANVRRAGAAVVCDVGRVAVGVSQDADGVRHRLSHGECGREVGLSLAFAGCVGIVDASRDAETTARDGVAVHDDEAADLGRAFDDIASRATPVEAGRRCDGDGCTIIGEVGHFTHRGGRPVLPVSPQESAGIGDIEHHACLIPADAPFDGIPLPPLAQLAVPGDELVVAHEEEGVEVLLVPAEADDGRQVRIAIALPRLLVRQHGRIDDLHECVGPVIDLPIQLHAICRQDHERVVAVERVTQGVWLAERRAGGSVCHRKRARVGVERDGQHVI